jgi:GWxTD domain-containing protein
VSHFPRRCPRTPAIIRLLWPVLMAAVLVCSAGAVEIPPLHPSGPPFFTADVAVALDAEGRPGLAISVSIPCDELQWLKVDRGYSAAVEVSVSFQPRTGRLYGDAWERRIMVASFEDTRSTAPAVTERRTFDVPPGTYEVRVTVRDFDADVTSLARQRLTVPDYSRIPVGFADLELGVVDSTEAFQPVPTRAFGSDAGRLAARVTLFDRRPGSWPRPYAFRYRILDDQGAPIRQGTQPESLGHSAEPVVLRPDSLALFIGGYAFEVQLDEGKSHWRVERSFSVEESGPPRGREFDRMLEVLAYIADSRELDHLKSLPPEDQAHGWDEFWKRRDPTPDTQRNEALLEFLRRVRYAEAHFQGYGPGWRSDMGRIYIKFGPPEQVESRPASSFEAAAEVWYYGHPYRRFVFHDRDGFGRYVLDQPAPE